MPVDQLPTRPAPRPAARLVQYDQYIDTQIQNTRRAVKAVDWATSLLQLVIGVLLFLLTAAVVDHWIIPGGFSVAMRTILFAVFVGGNCYFAYRRLWPLCRQAINPVYAAQTIEQASPTLKNSLINLLLFRQQRAEISDAVYHTLEEQAAQGLTRASVDSAVDRTALIHIGYVLLGVVGLAALYKVLSPKDPVVTAERVLLPWSDILPASRVSISGVTPGTVTISRGEFLDVSAEVRGIDEDDAVLLRYTTDDGQAVDKPIEMKLSEDGLRFAGRLPDVTPSSGRVGLAQNVRYRIEAGDARSLDYQVLVVPAPSILVERIDYDYPDYTGYVDRGVEGSGDIRAIEGTRVTIHARANSPIKQADVDFDADGRRDLAMSGQDVGAQAKFELKLREDRQTPQHVSYVLRFTNAEDRTNRDPVKYPIAVEPDRSPEATILRPQEKSREVRLNETVTIEAEARDPDFALAEVRLHGEVAGRRIIDEQLLAGKHTGRFTGRYQFTPSKHNLRAGDVVKYWVAAGDIRTPTANTVESPPQVLRIASPDPVQQPPPDRIAQRDRRQQPNQGDGNQQQEERRNQQQPGGEQNQGDKSSGQGENQSQDGEPASAGGDQQRGEGEQPSQGEQSGPDTQRSANPAQGSKDAAKGENQSQDGEPASAGGEQQRGQREPQQNDEQTGAGAAGGESSQQGSQPAGTRQPAQPGAGSARPDGNNTARQAEGQRPNGNDQQQPATEKAPVSSEGDNDAEAFERIQKHMERKGDLKEDEPGASSGDEQLSRDERTKERGPRSADPKQGDTDTGKQGEGNQEVSKPDAREDAPARTDGESASADGQKAEERTKGSGADTKQDDMPDEGTQPREGGEQTKSPGGQQTNTKGSSGAGNEQKSQGSPNAQPEMKPTEKRPQQGSSDKQTDQQEPPAGARGNKESDSQGEQGGDKAGGGEEGGGQKSPRDGTGSAGQNQSADEGSGESSEKGAGNNSPNAGQDATADHRTGQPGEETTGRGSSQRDGEGTKPGGAEQKRDGEPASAGGEQQLDSNQQPKGEPANRDGERSADRNQKQQEPSDPNQRNGTPTGEGGQTGSDGTASPSEGVVPEGDAANLEYARKQTDLVLDKLADQLKKKQVDKNLLEQLGWTEDQLRRFVSRWQERKAAARRNNPAGEAASRELDDALRSLGLRRGALKQGPTNDDTQRDLRQGFRGPVPVEYQERLRAYSQGVSRARQDDE